MTARFKVYVTRDISEHDTFEEAFKIFWDEMMKLVHGGTSRQTVETACWIEGSFEALGKTLKSPLYFYDARDFGHDNNLLERKGGKLVVADPLPAIPIDEIVLLFAKSGLTELQNLARL